MADEKESKKTAASSNKYITVKAAVSGRVALFERDEAHPDGEAFVAYETPVQVGETSLVLRKIADGELIKV